MRREPEFFHELELTLLHIAKTLKEALGVEQALTAAGVEYVVETDNYRGGVIFASERVGAFFYVLPEMLTDAREALSGAGIRLR